MATGNVRNREMVRFLKARGFTERRTGGKHTLLHNGVQQVTLSRGGGGGRELTPNTVRAILKHIGASEDEWQKWRKGEA